MRVRFLLPAALLVASLVSCEGGAGARTETEEVADAVATPSASVSSSSSSSSSASPGATESTSAGSQHESQDGGTRQDVLVYFNVMGGSCQDVEGVSRRIPETRAVATAALKQLFAGPTAAEKEQGLRSLFSRQSSELLRDVYVEDGTAYVDLSRAFLEINNASTSCGAGGLLASMDKTVQQFPTVDVVRYAVEGRPEQFYNFLQIGCPAPSRDGDRCDADPFQREG